MCLHGASTLAMLNCDQTQCTADSVLNKCRYPSHVYGLETTTSLGQGRSARDASGVNLAGRISSAAAAVSPSMRTHRNVLNSAASDDPDQSFWIATDAGFHHSSLRLLRQINGLGGGWGAIQTLKKNLCELPCPFTTERKMCCLLG